MQTVKELIDYIADSFPVGPSTNCYRAITGEPYVVIGSQHPSEGVPRTPGTVDEGKQREWGFDEHTAVMQAAACFQQYAEGRSGTLYWRHAPSLEKDGDRYIVYLRCLISEQSSRKEPCDRCNCGYATQSQSSESRNS